MIFALPIVGAQSDNCASNPIAYPPLSLVHSNPVSHPSIQYQIRTVKSIGISSIGGECTVTNNVFIGKVPVAFNTNKNSAASFLLPNNSGIFMMENTTIIINEIALKIPKDLSEKKLNVIYLELLSGNFAMCLPEKSPELNRVELTLRNLKLIIGNGTSFLLMKNIIYVTRGNVNIDGYIITENHSAFISTDQPIQSNKMNITEVMDASFQISEACFAGLFLSNSTEGKTQN